MRGDVRKDAERVGARQMRATPEQGWGCGTLWAGAGAGAVENGEGMEVMARRGRAMTRAGEG